MPKRIALRAVTAEEKSEIERLAKAHSEPMRRVMRARVVAALLAEPGLPATEAGVRAGLSGVTGVKWVTRFNAKGLAGLEDEPRPGRPPTHDEQVRSHLIDLALQKPSSLGEPYALWTLGRLQRAFKERYGLHLSDSTIWTWLDEEGVQWKRQQSWFHEAEQHDPEFAEKRGALSGPI
jgi:transposase